MFPLLLSQRLDVNSFCSSNCLQNYFMCTHHVFSRKSKYGLICPSAAVIVECFLPLHNTSCPPFLWEIMVCPSMTKLQYTIPPFNGDLSFKWGLSVYDCAWRSCSVSVSSEHALRKASICYLPLDRFVIDFDCKLAFVS